MTENSRPLSCQASYSRSQDRVMNKPTTVVNKEPLLSSVASGSATITRLSTRRVRPIKQRTRHGVVEVLEDGTVFLDFNEERWLMTVDSEGEKINFFERPHTRGSPAILVNPVRSYTFHELPPKHLKKYRYAAKFVDLVKSKTPKVSSSCI
ncbi:hypothetical protein BC937DRAFT_91631 [Endogone sp. FLAS-F59071]|nr:hypothetical protein BC937DRAFT_91631 [Endogone sp. FLAS-F59071]|eukprot:RUS16078.1 hypothetical protein BC937DRAFT_91631 [Endogone sp. FLAS-F59071]